MDVTVSGMITTAWHGNENEVGLIDQDGFKDTDGSTDGSIDGVAEGAQEGSTDGSFDSDGRKEGGLEGPSGDRRP